MLTRSEILIRLVPNGLLLAARDASKSSLVLLRTMRQRLALRQEEAAGAATGVELSQNAGPPGPGFVLGAAQPRRRR